MRSIGKIFSSTLIVVMLLSLCTLGFASGDEGETAAAGDGGNKEVIQNYLKENVSGVSGVTISTNDMWVVTNFTTDPKQAAENAVGYSVGGGTLYLKKHISESQAVNHINSAIANSATNENMQTLTNNLNIVADTSGATALISGFTPIISLVVGIIVALVTIGMTIFSAFDIAYIAFPVFRNKCEDAKTNGGAMAKTTANGETKLRFVTDEAVYAVQECNIQNGKSPWAMYFKKRVLSYILLAIILFILMTGNISLITGIALNIVSGIMNVLGGLA